MKKTILLALLIISSLGFSQATKFRNTSLDTGAVQVNAGYTNLLWVNVAYGGTQKLWLKFYDSKTHPYSSSAVPVLTMQIPSSSLTSSFLTDDINGKISFKNGLWVRCTSGITDTSTAVPASKPIIEIGY